MEQMTFFRMFSILEDYLDKYRGQIKSEELTETEAFIEYADYNLTKEESSALIKLIGLFCYSNYLWLIKGSDCYNLDSIPNFDELVMYQNIASYMDGADADDFVDEVLENDYLLNFLLLDVISEENDYQTTVERALKTKRGRQIYLKFHPELDAELQEFNTWYKDEMVKLTLMNLPITNCGMVYYLIMLGKENNLTNDGLIDVLDYVIISMDDDQLDLQNEIISTLAMHFYTLAKIKEKENNVLSTDEECLISDFAKISRDEIIELILFDDAARFTIFSSILNSYNVFTFSNDVYKVRDEETQFSKKMQIKKPVTQ